MTFSTRHRFILAAILIAVVAASGVAQLGGTGDRTGPGTPRSYRLTITANIRNADVYIDGVRQRESTPASFNLRPGTYTLRIEARGYRSWEGRVTLDSNETIRAELVPPTATVYLEVPPEYLNDRVRDPWRMIDFYIDGRLRRGSRIEVDSGYHDIAIVSGGLRFEDEFYFEGGRDYTLELILRTSMFSGGR
ncbi:MAG: PEGA domain-containing protein [Spirochaetales bacterium]